MTRVNSQEVAEDITAEAFTRFIENESSQSVSNQRAWLVSIARNIIRDRFKQQQTRKTDSQPDADFDWENVAREETNVEQSTVDAALIEIVNGMLKDLPELTKEIITLRVWEEFSFKEIAEVVGEKETTVKLRYYRAIDEMKKTQDQKARSITIPLIIAAIREQSKLPEFAISPALQAKVNLIINNHNMEKNISHFHITKQGALLIAGIATIAMLLTIILVVWVTSQTGNTQTTTVQPTPTEEIVIEPEPAPEPVPVPAEPVLQTFTHQLLPGFSMQYYDDWELTVAEDLTKYAMGSTFGKITATFAKEGVNVKVSFYFSQDDGGAFCTDNAADFQNLNGKWYRFVGETLNAGSNALYTYSANASENEENFYLGDGHVYKACDFGASSTSLTTSAHTNPVIALDKPIITGDASNAQTLLAEIDAMIVSMQGIK